MTDPLDTAALVALARALLADDCRTDATLADDAVTLARGLLALAERERRLVEALRPLITAGDRLIQTYERGDGGLSDEWGTVRGDATRALVDALGDARPALRELSY